MGSAVGGLEAWGGLVNEVWTARLQGGKCLVLESENWITAGRG